MATFNTHTFIKHDDYTTPFEAWNNIKEYIPRNKSIWCPFYCDGNQKTDFQKLGFDIIHEEEDFFENDKGDVIIDNPPFSKKKEVFTRLKQLGKPFIMICPSSMINTQYIRQLFKDGDDKLQIIIPKGRIHFIKKVDGVVPDGWGNSCNFDCFYYCWKMNLSRDIIWLD